MRSRKHLLFNCIVVFLVVLFLVLPLLESKGKQGYHIVFLGDSIIGNEDEYGSVTDMVSERLGVSVFNGALGGTTCSFGTENLWGSFTNSQWSLVKLADAIAYNDWQSPLGTMQYADYYSDVNTQALPYFKERMEALSQVDFTRVDILIIEHGSNDYNCGRKLDNPEDLYDITTFGGAMRHSLRVLQKAYPDLQIVLLSPIYCEFGPDFENPCYSWDRGYGTLDDYVALEKQIAEEFGVAYIDAYYGSGIWEENAKEYLYDGLHLTTEGVEKMGQFIAESLSDLVIK